jgi:hypothetical protein
MNWERLKAAETLLEQADDIIEILLGDARHLHAEDLRAAIERHWEKYPDELPDGPPNELVSKGGKMRLKQFKGRIYTPESDT